VPGIARMKQKMQAEDALMWAAIQQDMNDYGRLCWTFLSRSLKANFLDHSLTLECDGSVTSTIFECELA
jgi:hypothetical protein